MARQQQHLMRMLLFRVLLPGSLLAASFFRYNAISFVYLLLLLCTPLLHVPSRSSMRGLTGKFLIALIPISLLPIIGHIVFHVTLVAVATDKKPYGHMFPACSADESLVRQIGFQRLDSASAASIIRLIVPDVLIFIVSIVVYALCRRSVGSVGSSSLMDSTNSSGGGHSQHKSQQSLSNNAMLQVALAIVQNLALAAAGTVVPSVLGSVYLIVFLALLTLWGCYKSTGMTFGFVRIVLLCYTALHLILLYLYQFQFFQNALDPSDIIARVLGLTGVIRTDCNDLQSIHVHDDLRWWIYVNPGLLLITYWILAFVTCMWRHEGRKKKRMASSLGVSQQSISSERQVDPQSAQAAETSIFKVTPVGRRMPLTGSMVFSGSSYGIDVEDDGAEDERLVDAEVPPGGQYGGINNQGEPEASTSGNQEKAPGESGLINSIARSISIPSEPQKRKPWISFLILVVKQSYVLSLIGMMAWSITYHSWLTFALLLAACILWMMPNSRIWCLRASPVILVYAELLLLAQYVFCMNLKKELPEYAGTYKLQEIGMKEFIDPFPNLLLQLFFILLIVLSVRQFATEGSSDSQEGQSILMRERGKRKSIIERLLEQPKDIIELGGDKGSYDSNTTIYIGHFLWLMLCKYWIFFCTAMLAVIALQEVVIYRIIYMILFIVFLLAFQFNYTMWRKCMYVFWWVVIIYSMVVLVIIYTYQFEDFHGYWHNATGFNDEVLKDIGLEQYNTAGLFIKLLTPTIFVIIIILQVRYFHQSFLKLSAVDRFSTPPEEDPPQSEEEARAQNITEDEEDGIIRGDKDKKKEGSYRNWMKRKILEFSVCWQSFTVLLWRVGEIHIFKVIILILIIVAVNEVSALTFIYVLLVGILLPCPKARLLLSHLIQLWTAVIILAKMIFQLNLVPTDYWMSTCDKDPATTSAPFTSTSPTNATFSANATFGTNTTFGTNATFGANATDATTTLAPLTTTTPITTTPLTTTPFSSNGTKEDNAIWFGLMKISTEDISLAYYERLYLLIMFVIAFESIIRYHQRQYYNHPNHQKPKQGIIFIQVTRPKADEGFLFCLKYFANYFFYKFGLECCFIMTAITICVRVDAVSVMYVIVMLCFLMMSRVSCARFWPLYKLLLAICLPIEFLEVLGLPLGACLKYPWIPYFPENLTIWLYLPDYVQHPIASKLIADTLQLLCVCLQSYTFHLESKPGKMEEYGGGDNKDILEEVEESAVNPVPDFTVEHPSFMNNIKTLVFEYMFWVTMAIVFVTGVSRINIFSLFYVIAVFAFMWYGSEFFLKPLRTLLRMWNILIIYNIFVMCMKATLQLIGCVYINEVIDHNMCWLVQLFGINCLISNAHNLPAANTSCVVEEDDAGLAWDVVCFTFLLLQRRIYSSHYFRHTVDTLLAQNNLVSRGAEIINRIMIREVYRQREQESKVLDNIKEQMSALKEKQARLRKDYKEPEEHFQAIRAGDYFLFEEDSEEVKDKPADPTSLTIGTEEEQPGMNPLQVINTATEHGAEKAVEAYKDQEGENEVCDVDGEDKKEKKEEEKEPGPVSKIRTFFNFLITLWYSLIDWFIALFNRLSANYRLVAKQLAMELINEKRKILKMRQEKLREKLKADQEEPTPSDTVRLEMSMEEDVPDVAQLSSAASIASLDQLERLDGEQIEEEFCSEKNRIYRLFKAFTLLLVSRSELLCYFLMILNQMVYGSLLSLPLPLMVFLWGMLSVPRPSKTFWVTVITYTEAIVVCKYLFQFGFFPWNGEMYEDYPFFPPRIIGIEKRSNYANVDIALLLALFLHRSILRKYGLWRDSADISADMEAAGMKEKSHWDSMDAPESAENESKEESVEETDKETEPKKKSKIKQGISYMLSPFTTFFKQVTESSYNATVDVYAPMFGCDFILFLVLVFGFNSFGPAETAGGGNVTTYLQDNKIPVPFLVMLIIQFVFIVIDRALFLRKLVFGKFLFQILSVIIIHIYMFFVLPLITKRSFFLNTAAQIFYFIKCIYFGLSAYQIRCGYPNRILGNFLTKKYGYVNLFLFKGFLAIPFLLELRALMDWIWTDSTLAISSWLQMEDIYANIFVLKCWREIEKKYPTPRSNKKGTVAKYVVGGLLLFIIIFIIWFPLVFFSFFNSVFLANPPTEAQVTVGIGGYQPLFKTTVLTSNIRTLTGAEFNNLKSHYSKNRGAYAYISNFESSDVTLVTVDGHSLGIWGISPVSQKALIKDLENDKATAPFKLTYDVTFKRAAEKGVTGELSNSFEVNLRRPEYSKTRHGLADLIKGARNTSVEISEVFPRFLRLGRGNEALEVEQLVTGPDAILYSNISLLLQHDPKNDLSEWWDMFEIVQGPTIFNPDPSASTTSVPKAYFITFNDRKVPQSLSFISGYGVIGLYISFILLIGRLLRLSTTKQYLTIMFRELPDVDKIMCLCLDLYLVREMKDFQLEEDLYAKMIFLYRSPQTMIKYTRQTIRIGNLKQKED